MALEAVPTLITSALFLASHYHLSAPANEPASAAGSGRHQIMLLFGVQLIATFVIRAINLQLLFRIKSDIATNFVTRYRDWRTQEPLVVTRAINPKTVLQGGTATRYLTRYLGGMSRALYSFCLFAAAVAGLSYFEALPLWLILLFLVFGTLGAFATFYVFGVANDLASVTRTYISVMSRALDGKGDPGSAEALAGLEAQVRDASMQRILFGTAVSALMVSLLIGILIMEGVGTSQVALVLLMAIMVSTTSMIGSLTNAISVLPFLEPFVTVTEALDKSTSERASIEAPVEVNIICRPNPDLPDNLGIVPDLFTAMAAEPAVVRLAGRGDPVLAANFFFHLAHLSGKTLHIRARDVRPHDLKFAGTLIPSRAWDVTILDEHHTLDHGMVCFIETISSQIVAQKSAAQFVCECSMTRLVVERQVGDERIKLIELKLSDTSWPGELADGVGGSGIIPD